MEPTARIPLSKASTLADKIMSALGDHCASIMVAGSIRRGLPDVGDVDIVCLPHWQQEAALAAAFRACAMTGGIILDGRQSKRCQLRRSGIQLDLWVAHHATFDLITPLPGNWGAMLLTYTGSPSFNIRCVARAKELGKTFRPGHGVIEEDGTVHSLTEGERFDALRWDFIPPGKTPLNALKIVMNAAKRLTLLRKYRAMWAEAAAILITRGYSKTEAAAYRDEVTIQVLGHIKSSADFTEPDFDCVFQQIDTIIRPDDLQRQIEPPDARLRRQLLYSIAHEEKFPGYAIGIAADIYHRRDIENLPTEDLLTLSRRIGNDLHGYKYSPRRRKDPA